MKMIPPEFMVKIDENCIKCKRCVSECSFGALKFDKDRIVAEHEKCVACHRCVSLCPAGAITVVKFPLAYKENSLWGPEIMRNLWKQSESGAKILTGAGNDRPYPVFWDRMLLDACQVTNPSIDPLREPMELRTYIGKKPDRLEFWRDKKGEIKLTTVMEPQIKLETPIIFAGMSYGAVSLNVQLILAKAARELGTVMNTGEGGLPQELLPYKDNIIVQCASGRFGVNLSYLNSCAAIEIKIGQGAKPGIGGHLPGEKVTEDISRTRMIPAGTDAISPAPHHDIYSIEDLRQLIYALKEATRYKKPVGVKIAAVHNVAAIASGVVRAGADILTIDGFRGGTGAAPQAIRDHVGIPIELALARVDEQLRKEGIRHMASIIASGGIRQSADVLKAIALGADAVAIGTSALIAMGCHLCQKCHTGLCAWGIATQKPELVKRLDVEEGAKRLTNMIKAWNLEIKEILGALGVNSIESLRGSRERLRGIDLDEVYLDILGIKPAGR
ncbi:glutamate synthase-related protein [Thermoanaerobacterium sp. DL9XJH110]|uniref:glutamate synthase-related protein n=1 Tax=Thermoanaerobacterium sp. DL9XJH110 TaxID=3386643 RepID=UPI003BB798C9